MITYPAQNAVFKLGQSVLVEGRAWVGEGAIAKVELSFDEGATWQDAQLNAATDKYAWRTFSTEYRASAPGYTTVLARASDDRGNVQPLITKWNPLGYFSNGVHRVGFLVEA